MRDQLEPERAKAIIRAQSTLDVMGAECTRKVKEFAAILAAIYGSDFGSEKKDVRMGGAIAWKLFWTAC